MYWCFHCYAVNPRSSGPCVHCGEEIAAPAGLSYDEQLIWALGHPDGDRAIMAAHTLGVRGSTQAAPHLRQVVEEEADPFLATEALRSLIAIEGVDPLRPFLESVAEHAGMLPAKVATEALGHGRRS